MEQRQLILITRICHNPLTLEIIIRQIAVKSLECTRWVVATQLLLRRYNLPPLLEVVSQDYSPKEWKRMVTKVVSLNWKRMTEKEADIKYSLAHLNYTTFTAGKPHLVWEATTSDSKDVRRAIVKAKMIAGAYTLQSNRAAFNQTTNKTCPQCEKEDGDIMNFITSCPSTQDKRDQLFLYKNRPKSHPGGSIRIMHQCIKCVNVSMCQGINASMCQMSLNLTKCTKSNQIQHSSPNRSHWILPNPTISHWILPNLTKFLQISSRLTILSKN